MAVPKPALNTLRVMSWGKKGFRPLRLVLIVLIAVTAGLGAGAILLASGRPVDRVFVVIVVVVALLGAAATHLLSVEQDVAASDAAADRARRTGSTSLGQYPCVKDVPPRDFGARDPLIEVPYKARAVEHQVLADLNEGKPVVIVATAMKGKSRVGANILHENFPAYPLVRLVPAKANALITDHPPTDSVVWLDDLERFLARDDLRDDWVQLLEEEKNIVLATMRTAEWTRFNDTQSEIRLPGSRELDRFQAVFFTDNPEELEAIAATMPDASIAAGVATYGLGEYLAGAPKYLQRLRAGETANPDGVAFVKAAVDFRRAGLGPVSIERLNRIVQHYLPSDHMHREDCLTKGMEWATAGIEGLPGLLEQCGDDYIQAGLAITDHLRDQAPPKALWEELAAHPPKELSQLAGVGRSALEAGQVKTATALLDRASLSTEAQFGADHPDTLASRNNLAGAYESAGDLGRAIPLYEQTLTDSERVLGPDHPQTLASRNKLAYAYRADGRHA